MSAIRRIAFALILASWCVGAVAATGNELVDLCGIGKNDSRDDAFCLGYVSGVVDVELGLRIKAAQPPTPEEIKLNDRQMQLAREQLPKWNQLAPYQQELILYALKKGFHQSFPISRCVPSNVTNGQLVEVVKKYLRDNPAQWHLLASELVVSAFQNAFPCK